MKSNYSVFQAFITCILIFFVIQYVLFENLQEVKNLPNIKSAIKRVKVSNKKALNNTVKKSTLKSTIKKCKAEIANKDKSAQETLNKTITSLDKAAACNLIHKNAAARKKSRLTKALNASNK